MPRVFLSNHQNQKRKGRKERGKEKEGEKGGTDRNIPEL
jgi:hypothetical protein